MLCFIVILVVIAIVVVVVFLFARSGMSRGEYTCCCLLFTCLFTQPYSHLGRTNFFYRSLPAKDVSESMEDLNTAPADTQDDEPILPIN